MAITAAKELMRLSSSELNWIDIYWNQKDYKPVHGSFLMANKTILNLET